MAVAAADVPGRYDLVLTVGSSSYGFAFLRTLDGSYLTQSRHRATYAYTPTFLERTNVTGAYGDDQQQFYLTVSQNDWSEGEGQRFFRGGDKDSIRKYWQGTSLDTSIPGQVFLRGKTQSTTISTQIKAACPQGFTLTPTGHAYVSSTNLWTYTGNGSVVDQGAHGAGTPNQWGMCTDSVNVYVAGASKIRKWTGSAFSDFSATTNAGSLAFLNNALYSCDGSTLKTYDGSGNATTLFTWKDATNTALVALTQKPKIIAWGGKLLIYFPYLGNHAELWVYDGTGTSRILSLPPGSMGYDIVEIGGVVYLSAIASERVVYFFANGSFGEVWRPAKSTNTTLTPAANSSNFPALGTFNGRLYFTDSFAANVKEYDPATGAITSVVSYTVPASNTPTMFSSSGGSIFFACDAASSALIYIPYSGVVGGGPTGTLISSIFDFDNSLTKQFRSIKVDWDGDAGGVVDIYYQVDSVDGSWTLLQAAAVSGTDYTIASASGRGIAVKLALSATDFSLNLKVKRLYVRGAPLLQTFAQRVYNLDLGGDASAGGVALNDGTQHPLSGADQAANLITAITATAPITVTDRFGSFTGVLEPGSCSILEVHSGGVKPTKTGQFVASLTARQV